MFIPAYSNAHFSQFIKSPKIKSNLAFFFPVDVPHSIKSAFSNRKRLVSVLLYALRASLSVSAELVSKTSVHVYSELHSQTQEGKQHFIFSFNTVCSYQTSLSGAGPFMLSPQSAFCLIAPACGAPVSVYSRRNSLACKNKLHLFMQQQFNSERKLYCVKEKVPLAAECTKSHCKCEWRR